MTDGTLFYGDCLDILRGRNLKGDRYIKDDSVDLIYLDPPFNSNKVYNVIFKEPTGHGAASQVKGFEDTWTWNDDVAKEYEDLKALGGKVADTMVGLEKILGFSNMFAYLVMMMTRLVEMRRVLKDTGTLYLHCDQSAGHYIKVVLDAIFGPENFVNEIIWCYKAASGPSNRFFRRKHDVIFLYSKTNKYLFYSDSIRVEYGNSVKQQIKSGTTSFGRVVKGNPLGKTPEDWWEIPIINSMAKERLGYPTQKPEALLERIIKASSKEGDLVLDPFCGCGTCVAVAQKLGRKWLGIDITAIAINIIKSRLKDSCPEATYRVIGEPSTPEDAHRLADSRDPEDKYQFQLWALGLDGARPTGKLKKGADKGIDGKRYFDAPGGKTETVMYSIKSGHVSAKDVRDLARVVDREGAAMGVLISMEPITRPMKEEAATAGFYRPEGLDEDTYPKVQLLTVEELMNRTRIVQWPRYLKDKTYKEAPRAGKDRPKARTARLTKYDVDKDDSGEEE